MAAPTVRPATAADAVAVEGFTQDTFEWGDYVGGEFLDWLDADDSLVLVGVDDTDTAVGVSRVLLLSPHEAWLHGARVAPGHRRQGFGRAMNEAGCAWAATEGAQVARLMVEEWNTAARTQVEAAGYRAVSPWLWCTMDLRHGVVPQTNGGRRVPGEERLTPGRRTEADMAWMAWSSSELARTARELFPIGWHFRRMRPDDLRTAASHRRLWHAPSGWIMQETLDDGTMVVSWMATSDLDASRLVQAVVDLADGSRVEQVRVMLPNVEWIVREVVSAGFEPHPARIYARPLG